MLFRMLTAIFKLHAVIRLRSCIRRLAAVFLAFQVISWGMLFVHNEQHIHAFTPGGTIVHVQPHELSANSDVSFIHSEKTSDNDASCPALEHALRTSPPVPVLKLQTIVLNEISTISQEVIAKRLEIVYLSHLTLSHAPKQSPPVA